MDTYPFPPEFKRPEDKEKPEYGLQYILAAYNSTNRFGSLLFQDNAEIEALYEIAQGRQSTTNMKRLFGFHSDPTSDFDDGPASLAYIDPQVLNLAPKYINRAVGKMQGMNFDIGLESIDLVSLDEKADYAAALQAFYRLKEWVTKIGLPLQAAFPDLDVDMLPQYPDELLYDIRTNPKLKKEIAGELVLQIVQNMNRFKQKMRQVDWDMVVTGWGHFDCYPDHNGMPRIKRVPHEFWGGSYVDNDDFEEQEYSFYLEPITVNQFIREASPFFKQNDLEYLAMKYSIQNSNIGTQIDINTIDNWDNLSYLPVIRFYFLSEDNRTFVARNNQYGSKIMLERDFNFRPAETSLHRYEKGGDSRIIKNTYTSVYGGSWIIGSNIVWNYGRKNIPRTNLVNASLPIKTFATNYKKGRAVSFTAQMIEPLYQINVAWNKIKETLARGWMGVRNVDLSAIEAAALGKGGNVWTPREVIEFLNMTNTAVGRRNSGNPYGQSNGDIVTHTDSGVTLADYFNTFTLAVNILESMTGGTVVESMNVPDRLPAKAVMASQVAGEMDMEYLYNAHEYLYERTSHMLLLLTQEALKNKEVAEHFMPALGKVNIEALKQMPYCEYAMRLARQPGPEAWAEFYQDVRIALENQMISISDSAYLREIDNLKQARQMLIVREGQHRRHLSQVAERNNQMAMEANQAAAADKFQYDTAVLDREHGYTTEIKKLEGQIKAMLQQQKAEFDSVTKRMGDEMKKVIKDQEGKYSIIKEGIRANTEKAKISMREERDSKKSA